MAGCTRLCNTVGSRGVQCTLHCLLTTAAACLQGFVFINFDRDMRDPKTREWARCRNSNLNEDLGKVGKGFGGWNVLHFFGGMPGGRSSWETDESCGHCRCQPERQHGAGGCSCRRLQAALPAAACEAAPVLPPPHPDGNAFSPACPLFVTPLLPSSPQIEYIFSDKTGTLTSNEMQLRQIAVKGVPYGTSEMRLEEHSERTGLAALRLFDQRLYKAAAKVQRSSSWSGLITAGGSRRDVMAHPTSYPNLDSQGSLGIADEAEQSGMDSGGLASGGSGGELLRGTGGCGAAAGLRVLRWAALLLPLVASRCRCCCRQPSQCSCC